MNEMITGKRTFNSMDEIREFSINKLNTNEIRKKFGDEYKHLSEKIIDLFSR